MRATRVPHDETDEIDRQKAKRRALERKDVSGVSRMFAEFESTPPNQTSSSFALHGAQSALEMPKGGESIVTFTDLVAYLRARFGVEEGQTMAEYGVVLAVIALGVLVAFTALSGGITNAINNVTAILG
jgi:Flp pilus assembly pilin Flp